MKSKKYNWKLHNKTVKHPYTGAKLDDRTCRNHGSCLWCRDNRQYQSNKKLQEMKQKLEEFLDEEWLDIGKFIDLTGQRFGRLTVLERSINKGKQKKTTWKCQCDCGNIITVFGYNLKNNHTKSCGCLSIENGRNKRKSNDYDLTGDYGIGYTFNKDSNGNNYFLFDLDDFVKIKDYCWRFSKQDYLVAYGGEKSTTVYLHSIIIGKKDGFVIDHINHNKFDNRKNNLRVCTHSQNMQNRTPKNVYGINGISYCKSRKKYEVYLTKNNKNFHLGYYDNLEDAIATRKEAEEKYFGEYSYANSVDDSKEEEAE